MYTQNYYVYVASESDDTVSLLKFDKNNQDVNSVLNIKDKNGIQN